MKKLLKVIFSRKIVIFLLLLLQIGVFGAGVFFLNEMWRYAYFFFNALSIAAVIYILNTNENPAYKNAWILPITVIPLFGIAAYVYTKFQPGRRKLKQSFREQHTHGKRLLYEDRDTRLELEDYYPEFSGLSKYLKEQGCPIYKAKTVEYFDTGETFFEKFKTDLKSAEKFILIEFFIVDVGSVFDETFEILKECAKRGVSVKFMYDGMGSQIILPSHFERRISAVENIECRVFNPMRPLVSTIQNNRDHRKIVVIDGEIAYTGGVNLADEYMNRKVLYGHWKDNAIRFTGEAVWSFTVAFFELWNVAPMDAKRRFEFITPDTLEFKVKIKKRFTLKKLSPIIFKTDEIVKYRKHLAGDKGFIIPYNDSPQDNENVGESVYLEIINRADSYVFITSPYLVIDHEMYSALTFAAKRGVDIRLLLPKIPDKPYMQYIARSFYRSLINAGVRIFEYTPGFIHAKTFISDSNIATVGSVNLDYRSLFLHYECGCVLIGSKEIKKIRADFINTLEVSQEITIQTIQNFNPVKELIGIILKVFAPLL
ncbi:MAG: phospholipase D-like domain-containing protein [Ruminococcus sp.]|jgi:cardiolipin synthase|nr:phospholipase D-like domain-containing protein [Ruminococcus sp.]